MRLYSTTAILIVFFSFTIISVQASEQSLSSEVIAADKVEWGYLNPLRGDKSPGAANLWGDRTKANATGILVRFKKGFSSPPHIHNISYRGIVIEGKMHNDDPAAKAMWMPAGSFWTQPAGEVHITAADGETNLIYLEIDSGPYLVKPPEQQFDNGERPINLHQSNQVWLTQNETRILEDTSAQVSVLWGSVKQGEAGGSLIKLPPGFNGSISAKANEFRAVMIKGQVTYDSIDTLKKKQLKQGSYFGSSGDFTHNIKVSGAALIYVRTNGDYKVVAH